MLLYRLKPHAAVEGTETFGRLAAARLLVLDDLGAERDAVTDDTRRTLLMLYEARHDAGRRTVWTSNKAPSEIAAFMGDDRLSSRIAGRCRVIELEGRDWRLANRDSVGPAGCRMPRSNTSTRRAVPGAATSKWRLSTTGGGRSGRRRGPASRSTRPRRGPPRRFRRALGGGSDGRRGGGRLREDPEVVEL